MWRRKGRWKGWGEGGCREGRVEGEEWKEGGNKEEEWEKKADWRTMGEGGGERRSDRRNRRKMVKRGTMRGVRRGEDGKWVVGVGIG